MYSGNERTNLALTVRPEWVTHQCGTVDDHGCVVDLDTFRVPLFRGELQNVNLSTAQILHELVPFIVGFHDRDAVAVVLGPGIIVQTVREGTWNLADDRVCVLESHRACTGDVVVDEDEDNDDEASHTGVTYKNE